jgi:hypothetical protein
MITFRVWVIEIAVTAVNYFIFMNKVYEPRYGKLRAHQIGSTTRIVYILVFAYFLLYFARTYTTLQTLYAGAFWLLLILAFEWIGSFLTRRPVREILEGWHVERGFMWPYVLLTYLLSPLIIGLIFHPGQ